MRVAIFSGDWREVESNINKYLENLETKYANFDIIEILQSSSSGITIISIWYKVMKG